MERLWLGGSGDVIGESVAWMVKMPTTTLSILGNIILLYSNKITSPDLPTKHKKAAGIKVSKYRYLDMINKQIIIIESLHQQKYQKMIHINGKIIFFWLSWRSASLTSHLLSSSWWRHSRLSSQHLPLPPVFELLLHQGASFRALGVGILICHRAFYLLRFLRFSLLLSCGFFEFAPNGLSRSHIHSLASALAIIFRRGLFDLLVPLILVFDYW